MLSKTPQFMWSRARALCNPKKIVATVPDMQQSDEDTLTYNVFHRHYEAFLSPETNFYFIRTYNFEDGENVAPTEAIYSFNEVKNEISRRYLEDSTKAMRDEGYMPDINLVGPHPIPSLTFKHDITLCMHVQDFLVRRKSNQSNVSLG